MRAWLRSTDGAQASWRGGWRYARALRARQIWSNFPDTEVEYVLEVDAEAVHRFLEVQGATWGARRDVIERAAFNLAQSIETIVEGCAPEGPLEVEASFDEFSLDVRISYPGEVLELPVKRPSNDEILMSEDGQRKLAGFLLRRQADRVQATHRSGRATVLFHFDH